MAELSIYAPIDGTVVALASVPDAVFAQKMVGDGIAIDPSGPLAVSPVAGNLAKLFPDGHAFAISTHSGIELIVHIGLDTVDLKGTGFATIATEGQSVEIGTPIVHFERTTIEHLGKVLLSPVVSCGNGTIVRRATGKVRAGRDILFVLQV